MSLFCEQAKALLCAEDHWLSNLSNLSAFIYENFSDLNWAGFYLLSDDKLVLGPFQGKVACTNIALGAGVCGTAAKTLTTQRIANVHDFAGHIACDSASNSELVVPVLVSDRLVGVLDLDSTRFERFSEADQTDFEELISYLSELLKQSTILSDLHLNS